MKKLLPVLAILALVAFLVWYQDPVGDSSANPAPGGGVESAGEPDARTGEALREDARPSKYEHRRSIPRVDAAARPQTMFRGRCVDGGGWPIAGVLTKVMAWAAYGERVAAWVKQNGAIDWTNPVGQRTGLDGIFDVRADLPPPYTVVLRLSADGYQTVQCRWSQLEPGAVKDFGDFEMPRGCVVRGRVLDEAGESREAVYVRLRNQETSRSGGKDVLAPRQPDSVRTGADGTFRLRTPVGPGKWRLFVRGEQLIGPKSIDIGPDDSYREVAITVRSKASIPMIRGIVVDERGQPVRDAKVRASGRWGRSVDSKADGTFVIERPEHEQGKSVKLTARKQGFENAMSADLVSWGAEDVRLVLRRGASIVVVVTDATTKKPVEDYRVRILVHGSHWQTYSSHHEGLRGRGPNDGGRMKLLGLRRGEYQFRIEPGDARWVSSGFRIVSVGERHASEVRFELSSAVRRTVRVVDAERRPVIGTKVELLEPLGGKPVDLETMGREFVDAFLERDANIARLWSGGSTGAMGELELAGPGGRPLAVRLRGPGHVPVVVRDVVLDSGTDPLVVEVRVGAVVFGRITPPRLLSQMLERSKGSPRHKSKPPGLRIRSVKFGPGFAWHPTDRDCFPIRDDGSFEFAGIAPGSWQLRIRWWQSHGPSGRSSRSVPIGRIDNLRRGERRKVEIDLSHLLFSKVRGRVELDGKPYEGQLSFRSEQATGTTMSNAKGEYEAVLLPGTYRLEIRPLLGGRATNLVADPPLVLAADQSVVQDFRILKLEFQLRILDSDGKPRQGVSLRAKRQGASRMFLTRSDEGGLSKTWLSPGSYTLRVWPKALSTQEAMEKFEAEHRGDRAAYDRTFVPVATVEVETKAGVQVVRLPVATGY